MGPGGLLRAPSITQLTQLTLIGHGAIFLYDEQFAPVAVEFLGG